MSALEQAIDAARRLSPVDRQKLIEAIRVGPTPPADANERVLIVESIRGKYRDLLTNSEDFMRRKREDLHLED